MNSRRFIPLASLLVAMAGAPALVEAQDPRASATPVPGEIYPVTVTPRAAPIPGFRYRLAPLDSERTPGDAATIYLRLPHETDGDRLGQLGMKPFDWLGMPLDRFPVAEARAFLDTWKSRIRQIEYAARRQTCDWNYTLPEEKEHAYEILLPDAQAMRMWARLVALKARVEMVEGKPDECVATIETGLSFARHVAEGPFLINALVGISLARTMLERVDELISRPDAPNLYWALTALPRPLIGIRKGFENEVKMTDWIFPELGEVDRPRTPSDWASLLGRFHDRMVDMTGKAGFLDPEQLKAIRFESDPAKFRADLLPSARAYLTSRGRAVEGWSDDQALLLSFVGQIRELRDEWAKPFYLSFPEAGPAYAAISRKYAAEKAGPLGLFVALAPTVEACQAAEVRLDRKVAALRIVEAIRMQAASDRGRFPDSLEKITVVPVPLDPSSGKAFAYRAEGDSFVLSSAPIYEGRLTYSITPAR